ncbi:hypothetical protein [Methanorbis furvi]|uniref:Uncharacterized protein n=1 Tax=Methanorbis furvi TaxID=3028299 RepID=A0AAE4ME43_9EURY|nr:hypothetical protein [Methanocorpusculaceae archaeon Ag1]
MEILSFPLTRASGTLSITADTREDTVYIEGEGVTCRQALVLIGLGIGIWALIAIPGEIKEAESTHVIELSNAFMDLKLSADKMRVNDLSGARFSMLMPGSSGMSGTTIEFEETGGKLSIVGTEGIPPKTWSVERLSARVGGTRGTTVIGYEGGGVFRSDNGHGVWLTPGLLEVYPDTTETNATVRVDMVIVNLSGAAMASSNLAAPVDFQYVERTDDFTWSKATNNTLEISFTGGSKEQRDLWYALFRESALRYDEKPDSQKIEVKASNNNGEYATLTINVKTGGDEWVKVYVREATYDVSLMKRYES